MPVNKRRVVITGLGVVAPNGIGKDAFWKNLVEGKSAVDYVSKFDASAYPCKVAAEVRDFNPADFLGSRSPKKMGRFSQFAVSAAYLAAQDSGISVSALKTAALCQGTAAHGISDLGEHAHKEFLTRGWRSVDPSVGLEYTAHAATAHVQAELQISGPIVTLASACCTGIDAIAWATEQIRAGRVEVALAVAADAPVSEFMFSLFCSGGYLSTWTGHPSGASRPYDLLRSGFVPSEGAVALVLEGIDHADLRNARTYAEVLGYGNASENGSASRQNSYASTLVNALSAAMDAAELSPGEIDYICAHGNSIPIEDRAEAQAHKTAFGECAYRIPISSIKSMLGQPFAASGLMQAAAVSLAIHHGIVPPTINLEHADPACDLDYVPSTARVVRIRHALLHSHSLGGHLPGSHSALALGRTPRSTLK
jgi:3-oxoacyl-[acyl-carrier-protein] synthase II